MPLTLLLNTYSETGHEPDRAFVRRRREEIMRAQEAMRAAKERQARYANKHRRDVEFKVGDKVLLSSSHLRLPEAENARRKLQPRFHGPYRISEVISPVAYRLDLPASYRAHPVVHISHLKAHHDGSRDFPGRPEYVPPPPPIIENGEEYSIIEQILKHRIYAPKSKNPVAQFWSKWEGHGNEETLWRSASQLRLDMRSDIYDSLIQDYLRRSGATLDDRWLNPPLPRGAVLASLDWIE